MSKKVTKNILICIPSYTFGGAEVHSLYTARALKEKEGVRVMFLAFGREDTFQAKLNDEGFQTIHFQLPNFLNLSFHKKIITLLRLIFKLRKFKFNAIFAGTEQCNLLMGLVWRFIGTKHFFWHQWGIDNRTQCGFWEKLVVKLKPTYVSNSEACSQNISNRHQLDIANVKVIHNTFNEELLNVKAIQQHKNTDLKIVMVANFFDEKDHITVIDAVRLFVDKYPDFKFKVYFVGRSNGSQLLNMAKAKAFDLDLYNYIEFVGLVEDISAFLSKMDLGLLSTKSEGLSNALLEYMAAGLPVIASDISQNREALSVNNKFFGVGNKKELFELFEMFYLKRDLMKQIGDENREFVVNHFSNKVYSQKVLNLLNEE